MQKTLGVVTRELLHSLGLTQGDHINLFKFLVQTEAELDEFMNGYYTGNIIRDVRNYQQYKRESDEPSFEEYDIMAKKGQKKEAIESLFKEPIAPYHVEYLDVYNVSHTELYNRYKENSNSSYLLLVKGASRPRTKQTKQKHSDIFLITS